MSSLKTIIPAFSLVLLAACNSQTTGLTTDAGGGSQSAALQMPQTGGSPTPDTAAQLPVPYDPLIRDEPGTRPIGGTSLIVAAGSTMPQVSPVSGSIGRNGTDFTLTDALNTLTDPNGPNSQGDYTEGRNELQPGPRGYAFAQLYGASYKGGANDGAATGVYGITTQPGDMPTNGTATFTGYGEISEVYPNAIPGLPATTAERAAISTVDVDFATGKTNAAIEEVSGQFVLNSKIDRISARGMALNGTAFSGSNVKMFDNGTRVYPTGNAATSQASGQFYGAKRDETGALTPAEVGGVMHSSSADGVVIGVFVAK